MPATRGAASTRYHEASPGAVRAYPAHRGGSPEAVQAPMVFLRPASVGRRRIHVLRASAFTALGALALGSASAGAAAIGALAIGRLAIARARIRALAVEGLEVTRLRVQSLEVV